MSAVDAKSTNRNGHVSLLGRLHPRQLSKSLATSVAFLKWMYYCTKRREGWFLENLTIRKAANMAMTAGQFAVKSERMRTLPVVVKIDISPSCNLSCTVCVHADPNGNSALEKQDFDPKHRMSVDQFRRIVDQIRGRTTAVSLYYIGDPLVHPNLDEMCGIAYNAGLNVHISTNFSFALTDARIRRIVESGLTHLSVCVDGLSQEKYQLTRVGGKIDRVLDNLKRICKVRDEMHRTYPKVEVQYIKFQHNVDELEAARKLVKSYGVDQVTDFWGSLNNYTDFDPDVISVIEPNKNNKLPQCFWPHSSMVVKYNGDVIPCCNFRIGQQYTDVDDARVLGNIFETSLDEVWNNQQFRDARRLVSNPELAKTEPRLKEHFCYSCPVIFKTTEPQVSRNASRHRHEDIYEMGADGRPIRKAPELTGLPDRRGTVSQIGLPNGEMASV